MIQRQQSLWLLLSSICAFFTFKFPFYNGTVKITEENKTAFIDAGDSLFLLLFTGISILLSLIAIFLFKHRKLQLRVCIGGIILSILIVVMYFLRMDRFESGGISLTSIFAFGNIAGHIFAARGIWKDQKLVRSLDKLR